MNIKISSLIVGLAAMVVTGTSCKKEYLETVPSTAVAASSVLESVANATAAVNGIHRSMYMRWNDQGTFGYGTIMINNECMGDDYVFAGQSNGWFLTAYRWLDHRNANGGSYYPYQFFYRIISNANVLITGIDKTPGDAIDKNMIKGQALAYRGWAYFNLVQLYGKRFDRNESNNTPGVPLVLTPTIEPQARATVAEVYKQVNDDLAQAETLLATARPRADKSNFNVNVVRGIQARVALTQQNWALAATKANQARQGFTLMSGAQQLEGFSNWSNPEWMWGSSQIDDQTEFFTAYLAYISFNFNSTNIRTNPKLINRTLYETMAANDVRRALWVPTPTASNTIVPPGGNRVAFMNQKFRAKDFANSVGDIPYMRAAEMFLIEAEALARNGNDAQAADVFTIFMATRVPGFVRPTATGDALITLIMNSRRVELWGEGFRFLDLKRLNLSLDRNGGNHNAALAVIMNMSA
ncbi:MAG: RagB/SusD family nutrient uptake outer membrane protein, partial [Sphingobacteriales bacterium]